jgi:phosphate:Na+ symporter
MDIVNLVFGTFGGLALFLYGMGKMSDGLKAAAGDRLRTMLGKVTRFRLMAMLMGTGVTCLIQSSSATTVIVVGLINAGLLTLMQATAVILGANIGTTVTAWLVSAITALKAFKISLYALPFIAAGFGFHTFAHRQRLKTLGQILLGLGLLFIGLDFMKDALGDLGDKENSPLIPMLQWVGDRPLLAILAGAAFTMLIQSSSASIAMVILLASQGQFGSDPQEAFRIAIPFILGDNIGTTVTAQLAALRTNLAGKRAAMAHTIFNVMGVLVLLPFVYTGLYAKFIDWLYPPALAMGSLKWHISLAHTAFNVSAAVIMLPFLGLLVRVVEFVIPVRKDEAMLAPVALEEHLLDTPSLAMQQIRKEILRMLHASHEAFTLAVEALRDKQPRLVRKVAEKEDATDAFQTQITRYLVALSRRRLNDETSNELPVLMHSVNDIERIGDHAMNISEIAVRKLDKGHSFGDEARQELRRMEAQLEQMFGNVIRAMENNDRTGASHALENEGAINEMDEQYRVNHITRMSNGHCQALAGLVFTDYLHNMEKIGDHLANIAQGILGNGKWDTTQVRYLRTENAEQDKVQRDATEEGAYFSEEQVPQSPATPDADLPPQTT